MYSIIYMFVRFLKGIHKNIPNEGREFRKVRASSDLSYGSWESLIRSFLGKRLYREKAESNIEPHSGFGNKIPGSEIQSIKR